MYLSQIRLEPDKPSVRQYLHDARDMHRSIMGLFDSFFEQEARKNLGVVYRVYKTPEATLLYLLSKSPPDPDRMAAGFAMPSPSKDVSGLIRNFSPGQVYRFDLLASPIKKVASEGKNSKRVFLTDPQQRQVWLTRKALSAGFKVNWVREDGSEIVRAALKKGEAAITCVGVRFVGELTVTDAEAFAKAYAEGIGVQRSYGFGLLLLAPAGDGA